MDIIRSYKKENDALRHASAYSTRAYCIKAGLAICGSLLAYFFVMKSFGLVEHLILRAFNIVFLGGGLLITLNHFKNKKVSHKLDYFRGLRIGLETTLWAVIPFAIFVGIYLGLDSAFMEHLAKNLNTDLTIGPAGAAVAVAAEGICSGLAITYIAMSYLKRQ